MSETEEKTHYVAVRDRCFKIDLFEGGFISYDNDNAKCQNEFTETRKVSKFDSKDADSYYYVKYDETARQQYTGKVTVMMGKGETSRLIPGLNMRAKTFNARLYLPTCSTGCKTDEDEILIDISPDSYPSETSWFLDDNCDGFNTVAFGTSNSKALCVPSGKQWTFDIYDTAGDGMCCGNPVDGSYSVSLNGEVVASGGQFLDRETSIFGAQSC